MSTSSESRVVELRHADRVRQLPVINDCRLAVQSGELQYARSKITPCRASASRFGVAPRGSPVGPSVPAAWSSVTINSRLASTAPAGAGPASAGRARHASTARRIATKDERIASACTVRLAIIDSVSSMLMQSRSVKPDFGRPHPISRRRSQAGPRYAPVRLSGAAAMAAGRPHGDDPAAGFAAVGAQVDHPVGRGDHVEVVLDDHDGVPRSARRWRIAEQAVDVGEMQARGRLVEDVEVRGRSRPGPARPPA